MCSEFNNTPLASRLHKPIPRQGLGLRGNAVGAFGLRCVLLAAGSAVAAAVLMQRKIKEREDRLTELDRLKSEFVSSVSHELRTPLTTISTLTHVLQRTRPSEEQRAEYLETIAAECDRQIDLITNLLDLSRIESGAYAVEPVWFDASQIIRDCARRIKHSAGIRQQEIRTELPDRVVSVLADKRTLRRAVCAIADNAVKYTPDHGTITLGLNMIGSAVSLYVQDTGCGISADDLPHIFERFYQGRRKVKAGASDQASGEQQPGTGLGLYVVDGLVKQLKGSIAVDSEIGRGSTFTIRLPEGKWASDESEVENKDVEAVADS